MSIQYPNREDKMKRLQKLLREIPKGKITTYKILAKKLRIHPRYVGKLLHRNTSSAPCFKVINFNGRLGGYATGLNNKIRFLKNEGIEIRNGKVDIRKFCYKF